MKNQNLKETTNDIIKKNLAYHHIEPRPRPGFCLFPTASHVVHSKAIKVVKNITDKSMF